jgi:hypothetical protein
MADFIFIVEGSKLLLKLYNPLFLANLTQLLLNLRIVVDEILRGRGSLPRDSTGWTSSRKVGLVYRSVTHDVFFSGLLGVFAGHQRGVIGFSARILAPCDGGAGTRSRTHR